MALLYYAVNELSIEEYYSLLEDELVFSSHCTSFQHSVEVTGFDDVISAKNRTMLDDVLQRQYHGTVDTIDLYFDIDNVKQQTSKADYQEIGVDSYIFLCSMIWSDSANRMSAHNRLCRSPISCILTVSKKFVQCNSLIPSALLTTGEQEAFIEGEGVKRFIKRVLSTF